MARHSPPSGLSTIPGEVYTLHFWPPFGNPEVQASGHYTGWAQEGRLRGRLTDHALGRGARLTQLQREAGGTWVVADVEPGTKDREHQLKYRSATRRCSVCRAVRDVEAGRITQEEALARWETARPADRAILREIFGMEPEPEAPNPVPVREMTPTPKPELKPEITPEDEALIDSLCEGWLRQQAEAEARAIAEVGPEAAPERARELLRSELYQVSATWPPPDPQVQAETAPRPDVQADAARRAEADPELGSDLAREVPAPSLAPDPQAQAETAPQTGRQLEAWPPDAEAERELEIGL